MKFLELTSGLSVLGQPIKAYRSTIDAKKYLYLIAGVHGDEVEGAYVLEKLFEFLRNQNHYALPLIVVPIVNIDGFAKKTRINHNGVDLNRNMPTQDWQSTMTEPKYNPGREPLSEPENQFLNSLFFKFPPGFILSFHSWKPILNYNGNCRDIAEYISKYNQYPLDDDIGYPTPGSLGTYGPEKLECPVLTFECPLLSSGITLEKVWQENQEALINLMGSELIRKKIE